MSRVPSYRRHSRGYGFVQHKSIKNASHRLYLGRYNSPESLKRYAAFIESLTNGGEPSPLAASPQPTVFEVVALYLQHAKQHYTRSNGVGYEYQLVKNAMKPVLKLHGETLAHQFGPKALIQIRTTMAKSGLARSTVNHHLTRIKRAFRWAGEQEIVPGEAFHKLSYVKGLYRGQDNCREAAPVTPASIEAIKALLPHLSPTVAAMLELQFYIGARPAEVCVMRACDIDMSGPIWLYRPHSHKNQWRGQSQVKAIPPVAQVIIKKFLRPNRDEYLFSPADSAAWHADQNKAQRKPRKTKLYPCEVRRVKQKARNSARRVSKQLPGDRYTTQSYRQALTRGFDRAAEAGVEIERFSPNQVRHTILTFVSQQLGQQAAQRWGGHASLNTTGIYVQQQEAELIAIADKLNSRLAV